MSFLKNDIDILIIGGGITGSATSILLQKAGYNTAIIEHDNLNKFKPGETLSPQCKHYLEWLGLKVSSKEVIEYSTNYSCWGSEKTHVTDFIFNPYGNGITINRSALESIMIKAARENGSLTFYRLILKKPFMMALSGISLFNLVITNISLALG